MKKHLLLNTLCMLFAYIAFSQVPQAICYQAAAKDPTGADLVSQPISIRASIVQGGPNGTLIYQERHPNGGSLMTDAFGLFSVDIGRGSYLGGNVNAFEFVPWATGPFWLRIEMDATGGSNFQLMGANQILSVPYALYAEGSNRALTADEALTAHAADTAAFALATVGDDDGDPMNEIQTLDYQNGQLSLIAPDGSSSGSIDLPVDNDQDPQNEIQALTVQNDTLMLLDTNGNPAPGGGIYFPADNDRDDTNEIQDLQLSPDGILSISGGNTTVALAGNPVSVAPGNSVDFPLGIGGEHVVLTSGQFQVPDDKVFFMLAGGPSVRLLNVGTPPFVDHPTTPNMPIINEEVVIQDCMCTGVLVDTSYLVEPVILDFTPSGNWSTYTVPDNKIFFIKSGLKNDQPAKLRINNAEMEFLRPSFTRGTRIMSFPEDTIIQPIPDPFGNIDLILTGYLLDKAAFSFNPSNP